MSEQKKATPVDAGRPSTPTTKRAIAIQYDRNGRYRERLFTRTETDDGVVYKNGPRCPNLDYLLKYTGLYEKGLHESAFDKEADDPKAYAIPDGTRLLRWVLKDGTVITCGTDFPQGDFVVLRTLDGRNMFVPVASVAYVIEIDGEDSHDA